jgi:hypothetical protein
MSFIPRVSSPFFKCDEEVEFLPENKPELVSKRLLSGN